MNNLIFLETKKPTKSLNLVGFVTICISTGGERGIRTPGPVTVNSFQDCRIRPLCHFSNKRRIHYCIASANIRPFFDFQNINCLKIIFLKYLYSTNSFLKT
jgi:hypothetical protein